jgi:hypothetical protein
MESEAVQTNSLARAGVLTRHMQQRSFSKAIEWVRVPDDLPAPCTEDGNCLVGLSVALALEAAMAFSLYGIWQVWQLIR